MIYICIPAHNEQQTVGVVLWKLRQVFTDFPRDYQLLVADDASTDKTAEVLEPYTRVLPLTVIRTDKRQGYAASLEMLLREAVRRSEYPKRDVVVTLQADFSEEPDDLTALMRRMEAGADVAIGTKVSKSKPPRTFRWSRTLAGFFLRGQKWPEGVVTPFEGYRAYRLYAVKRAIEDRAGQRLIRHEGWAAHAQLLKEVLPHARRVDVVDVAERTDRLQRPRREQPFAAAMQVRALSKGTEPPGLIGVSELDRIAATASRSRERGSLSSQAGAARQNAGGNGGSGRGRERQQSARGRGHSGEGRSGQPAEGRQRGGRPDQPQRAQAAGESRRGQGEGARRGEQTRSGRGRQDATATATAPSQEPKRRARGGQAQGEGEDQTRRRRPPKPAESDVETVTAPVAAGEPGAVPAKKKRRRRRKKSAGGAAVAVNGQEQAGAEPESASGTEPGESSDPAEPGAAVEGTEERKRRRRGGRRGGRGRKRGPRAETAGGEEAAAGGPDEGASHAPVESAPERDTSD